MWPFLPRLPAGIRDEHGHRSMQELGHQTSQFSVLSSRVTIFHRQVLPFDKASFAEALTEGSYKGCWPAGCRARVNEADDRNGLLPMRRERRYRRRSAADQTDELATLHVRTHAPETAS